MSRDEENSWDEPREEEERDEVCYYCQSHLSGNIPQKLAGTGTLNSDRLESCVPLVPSTIRRYFTLTCMRRGYEAFFYG